MNNNQSIFNLNKNKDYSFLYSAITIILAVFLVAGVIYAWTEPGAAPPGSNVDAPINTGSTSQTKTGALTTGGFTSSAGKIIHNLSNYDNIWGQWTTIGTPKSWAGLTSSYYGLLTTWNSDYAFFGLRDYGSDRKDVVIGLEQGGDNFRFQVAGNDKLVINSSGDISSVGSICLDDGCKSRWDQVSVDLNGWSFQDNKFLDDGENVIQTYDEWLRLNQSGNFSNGVYTPGKIRADGGFEVDGYEIVGPNADKLYANQRNTSGGGIWVSDDGGFYDYNNSYIDFRGSTGVRILESNGSWGDNRIMAAKLCIQDDCRTSWPSGADGYLPDNPATSNVDMNAKRIENLASANSSDDAARWDQIQSWAQQDIGNNCGAGKYAYGVSDTGVLQCRDDQDGSDTNDYVDSISFNTSNGVLTLGRTGSLSNLTQDLDGRYLTSYAETDPQVSSVTNGKWCRGTGSAVTCDRNVPVSGSGSTNYIPRWTGGTSLGNSVIYQSGSNIGVGLTGPEYKLHINGAVKATAYWYGSDRTLKKEINVLENSLEKVLNLQGVSFRWKDNNELSIGLIAQDVEKIFPEAVSTSQESGLKSIDYTKLIAPLIEALKEQQKEIEELQAEIKALKKANK